MTAPHIVDPAGLLSQALSDASPDLMRELLQTMINALLSADADAVCGAEWNARSAERTNYRTGYRHRPHDTRVGPVAVAEDHHDVGPSGQRRAHLQGIAVAPGPDLGASLAGVLVDPPIPGIHVGAGRGDGHGRGGLAGQSLGDSRNSHVRPADVQNLRHCYAPCLPHDRNIRIPRAGACRRNGGGGDGAGAMPVRRPPVAPFRPRPSIGAFDMRSTRSSRRGNWARAGYGSADQRVTIAPSSAVQRSTFSATGRHW